MKGYAVIIEGQYYTFTSYEAARSFLYNYNKNK